MVVAKVSASIDRWRDNSWVQQLGVDSAFSFYSVPNAEDTHANRSRAKKHGNYDFSWRCSDA
jgi:hypothetical protein